MEDIQGSASNSSRTIPFSSTYGTTNYVVLLMLSFFEGHIDNLERNMGFFFSLDANTIFNSKDGY